MTKLRHINNDRPIMATGCALARRFRVFTSAISQIAIGQAFLKNWAVHPDFLV